jgi:hypothetical protein
MNWIAEAVTKLAHHRSMLSRLRCEGWRAGRAALLVLIAMAAARCALAATTVEVLETEPASRAVTLGSGQTFYLRLAYSTDTPARIWARPYYQNREVNAGSNPSRVHEGRGEALAWFFFLGESGQRVDEIRITAGDGSKAGTHEVARLPVSISSGTAPAATAAEPAWLARLKSEEERLQREDYERRMSEPVSVGDQAFAAGFMLVVLALGVGGIALPILALRRWQGAWRLAAALPALWIGLVVLRIVVGTAADPTSHNLWPFEILQASVASLVLVGLLAVGRHFFGRSSP